MYNQRLEEYANFVFEDKYKDIKQAIKKSDNNRESLNILFNLASETQMEQIKTLKSRLVPYISQESRNGGSLTKDIITKFGDDFAEILRPVLRAVGTQKNKRWVLRDKESTDGGDSEEVVSKSKVKKCLMLVRAMMR